jgi:hypothetical protein
VVLFSSSQIPTEVLTMAETQIEDSIISKITMASIGCNPGAVKTLKPEDLSKEGDLPLARLYGKLSKVKYEEDKVNGQVYTAFIGNFEAINMQSGEVFKSGKMFLPKGISELVENGVKSAPEGAQVGFAFEVRSQNANNPIGYSYRVLALKSPEATDELKELRDAVLKAGTFNVRRLTGTQSGKGAPVIEGREAAKKSA